MSQPEPTSYWDYIRVEELLALQSGIEHDESQLCDDEVRFIVIHQIDELWMKLALREIVSARDLFRQDHVPETALSLAAAGLRRVTLIFKQMADHFALMETMRTQAYLGFRDKLSPASGFQSAQLREIEVLMGLEEGDRIPFGNEKSYLDALRDADGSESSALRRVKARLADPPSLKEAVYRWLQRAPIQGSTPDSPGDAEIVDSWIEAFLERLTAGLKERQQTYIGNQALTEADHQRLAGRYQAELEQTSSYLRADDIQDPANKPEVRRLRAAILFIESHRELPLLSWPGEIIDDLVEAEQSMLIFRQRHARMVERVIGSRVGTGGSDGVAYLDSTALGYRVFKEIWAARTALLRKDLSPPVQDPDFYGLRGE